MINLLRQSTIFLLLACKDKHCRYSSSLWVVRFQFYESMTRVLHAWLQTCQPPLSLWNTEQSGKTTSFNSPPLRLTEKCQNPKAERDHNKLITNRKWLHYGLKDRRESALWLQHSPKSTFLQGLGRARSPLRTVLPNHCLRPGALLRVSGGVWWGL